MEKILSTNSGGGGGGASSNSFTTMQPITGTSPTASTSTDTLNHTSSDSSTGIDGNSGTKTLDFTRKELAFRLKTASWFDDFFYSNTSNNTGLDHWTIAGVGTVGNVFNDNTVTNGHPGVLKLGLANSATAKLSIATGQRELVFDSSIGQWTCEWLMKLSLTPTAADDFVIVIGFSDSLDILANSSWGTYFLVQRSNSTSGVNYVCRCQTAITPTFTDADSGVAFTTNWTKFKIVVNTSGHAIFYINGSQVADISTNVPGNTKPVNLLAEIENIASTQTHTMYLDYVYLENLLTASR